MGEVIEAAMNSRSPWARNDAYGGSSCRGTVGWGVTLVGQLHDSGINGVGGGDLGRGRGRGGG